MGMQQVLDTELGVNMGLPKLLAPAQLIRLVLPSPHIGTKKKMSGKTTRAYHALIAD